MELLWWFVIALTMAVYPVVLIRGALRGKRWARETLHAMGYLGGDLMTPSAWRALPSESPRPDPPPSEAEQAQDPGRLPGRLVA